MSSSTTRYVLIGTAATAAVIGVVALTSYLIASRQQKQAHQLTKSTSRAVVTPIKLGPSPLCPSIPADRRPIIIGLAGGMGAGKSTVARMLHDICGAHIIDCDILGHSIYAVDSPGYQQVVAAFGADIINPQDRTIDRKKLGPIVFSDPKQLARLNDIAWPQILSKVRESITSIAITHPSTPTKRTIVVVEAAILIEAGWDHAVDEVWLVQVHPEESITRVLARNPHLTRSDVEKRLSSQMSNDERASHADVIIYNSYSQQNTQIMIQQELQALQKRYGCVTNTE